MKDKFLSRKQSAYMIAAALYTLWQASAGWLNTYWVQQRMGDKYTTFNFVLFFLAHAIATACFASRMDKHITVYKLKRLVLFSTFSTGLLTVFTAFAGGFWLVITFIFMGITAGFFTAFLSFYLFTNIPAERRGVTIGFSSAAGLAIHYLIFTLIFHENTKVILYSKTIFTAVVFLLLGILSLLLPLCKETFWNENAVTDCWSEERHISKVSIYPMVILFIILLFYFVSYGIQDFAATAYWMNGSSFLGHTRILLIIGFLAGGFLWDFKNRNILISTGFGLMALGFIAMSSQYKGIASFLGISGLQLSSVFFSLSIRLIFVDIARFYKRSIFISSLGLVLPMILKQVGILSASILYFSLGGTALFITSLVCIVVSFPFISILFEKLRDINIAEVRNYKPYIVPEEDSRQPEESESIKSVIPADKNYNDTVLSYLFQKYNFTKREKQILELAVHGLSKNQMAEQMNIRESTVKQHIRNILSKSEKKSIKHLIITAINSNIN